MSKYNRILCKALQTYYIVFVRKLALHKYCQNIPKKVKIVFKNNQLHTITSHLKDTYKQGAYVRPPSQAYLCALSDDQAGQLTCAWVG